MKFGLMIVENTDNIGDDIQSYAALKFLPKVDFYIDREKLDAFYGDNDNQQVAVIMNAWYMYNKFNWPPSPYINPLFISMHISKNDYYGIGTKFLDGLGGEYLKKFEPVGARDQATQEILEEKGIKSYISECLTLTLEKFDSIPKSDIVYLVDIDKKVQKRIKEYYPNEKFEVVTHSVNYMNCDISYNNRMLIVEELLKKYQGAKCVVTSRLHCALPCLALDVPVLMVYQEEFKDRMGSFLKYLYATTAKEIECNRFKYDISNPPVNKNDHITVRERIKKSCIDFIANNLNVSKECEQNDIYKILSWQDNLVNTAELGFRKQILDYRDWCNELEEGKDWSESQYKSIKAENDELRKGKDWLESQYESIKAENDELKKGKDWSESQYKSIKAENDELKKGKDWIESQYENIKAENDELKNWCNELEKGKDWLESQYESIKAEYDKLQKWCNELQQGKDWIEDQWKNMCKECEELRSHLNAKKD